jgi:hypothetical protein
MSSPHDELDVERDTMVAWVAWNGKMAFGGGRIPALEACIVHAHNRLGRFIDKSVGLHQP